MLTDDQFSRMLQVITGSKEDHDLLVRISTTLDNLNKSESEERERHAKQIGKLEDIANSAHKRIDALVKLQWMVYGGGTAVGVMYSVMKILGIVK